MRYVVTYKVIDKVVESNDYVLEDDIAIYKLLDDPRSSRKSNLESIMFILQCLDNEDIIELDSEHNDIASSLLNVIFDLDGNIDLICSKCKGKKFLKGICPKSEEQCEFKKKKEVKGYTTITIENFKKIKEALIQSNDFEEFINKLNAYGYKFYY